MKTLVMVTEAHIKSGKRQDASGCPIALAIYESLMTSSMPSVVQGIVTFWRYGANGMRMARGTLPLEAIRAYVRYDKTGKMDPFQFELEMGAQEDPVEA